MIILSFALLLSPPTYAAEDEPKACSVLIEQGPTLEQLRAKYGLPPREIEYAPYVGKTYEGAEFILKKNGFKLRFAEYPGLEFAWDSANDHLRFVILNWLNPLRDAGQAATPAPRLTGEFNHDGTGSSTFMLDAVDVPNR